MSIDMKHPPRTLRLIRTWRRRKSNFNRRNQRHADMVRRKRRA